MRRFGLTTGGLVSVVAGMVPFGVQAQDGGMLLTFGFENRIEIVGNSALEVPAGGTSVANVTALSFGFLSETELDRLAFNVSGALIVENPDDSSDTEIDFGRTALTFGYTREIPAALFEITGNLRTDDVGAFDGDIGDDDAEGTQTTYGIATRLEVGRTSPLGFAFGAGFDVTEFEDTVDPDLEDSKEARADMAAILRFSEVTTGRLGLRYSRREEDDVGTTVTETLGAFAGLQYAVSQRLDLGVELGLVRIDTENAGLVERTEGPEGRIRLDYDMPVGTAAAELRIATSDGEGERVTFEVSRALELPTGTLSARLGVTNADPTGTDLVGALDWVHNRPDSSIGLRVERTVRYNEDDDESVSGTTFSLRWSKQVNDRSQLALDVSYALEDAASERIEQTGFGAVYSHQLTADWNFNTGVGYRIRNDADGHAESPNVFISLSRNFEFRP